MRKKDFKGKKPRRFDKKDDYAASNTKNQKVEHSKDTANNDIEWYVPDSQVLSDVGSLSFANVLQDGISAAVSSQWFNSTVNVKYGTPGIMTIDMQPTYCFGTTDTSPSSEAATDPLNIAAKSVYSFVRKHNSGSANYDEVDLMQYYIAMDNVYMLWAWCVRLYGIIRTYNFKNRYMPEGLLGAMGIPLDADQEYLIHNLAGFRYMINNYAIRMSSLAVPTVMPIFKRHFWLYGNVFKDYDDDKAQMYVYNPYSYYTYDEVNGKLVSHFMATALSPSTGVDIITRIQTILNSMLDPLLYSQSIGIMSGDTLKAYEGNIFTFATIPDDYTIIPIYNEKVLTQIHNSRVSGWIYGDIEQTNNILWSQITSGGNYDNADHGDQLDSSQLIFNLPYNNPTPEDVMYGTRLMPGVQYDSTSTHFELYTGSENVVQYKLTMSPQNGASPVSYDKLSNVTMIRQGTNYDSELLRALRSSLYFSMFDWHPAMYVFETNSTGTNINWSQYCGDLNNYTLIDNVVLKRLHSAALCGEFGVPYTLTRA